MIRIFTLLTIVIFFSCNPKTLKNNALEEIEVNISIQYTRDYCGGANPPEELLKQMKIPQSLINTELILMNADKDFQETVKTDGQGEINKALKVGKYAVFFPIKLTATVADRALNKEFCRKWKSTPDATFEVTKEKKAFQLSLNKSCNPCELPRP